LREACPNRDKILWGRPRPGSYPLRASRL